MKIKNNFLEQKAQLFATAKHKGQFRKDGKTEYIEHPKKIVSLLKQIGINDTNIISAAWLHDVVEDCGITVEQVEKEFNPEIARIVASLTKGKDKVEYLATIKNSDFPVKIIKLVDFISNLSDLSQCITEKEKTVKNKINEIPFYLNLVKDNWKI